MKLLEKKIKYAVTAALYDFDRAVRERVPR